MLPLLLLQRPQRHLKNFIMFAAREAEFLFLLPTFSCVGVCRCMWLCVCALDRARIHFRPSGISFLVRIMYVKALGLNDCWYLTTLGF